MYKYIHEQKEYSLISEETPLLSNLNMLENIALIKEVHEQMPSSKAQRLAKSYLEKIKLGYISYNRPVECTEIDIFYVMFIRALMTKEIHIIIVMPISLIHDIEYVKTLIENIEVLNNNKNIILLDSQNNESNYKGCSCSIIK